jgi:hypothetical protein
LQGLDFDDCQLTYNSSVANRDIHNQTDRILLEVKEIRTKMNEEDGKDYILQRFLNEAQDFTSVAGSSWEGSVIHEQDANSDSVLAIRQTSQTSIRRDLEILSEVWLRADAQVLRSPQIYDIPESLYNM